MRSVRARGGGGCASKAMAEKKPTETGHVKNTVDPEVAKLEAVQFETAEPKAAEPWALTIEDYRDPESIDAQLLPRGGLEHAPVKLLKWEWIEKRADKLRSATTDEERRALALPRRQDLERDEPDAFYSAEEVRKLNWNKPPRHHAAIDRVCVARVGDVGPSGPARRQPAPPRRRDQEGADDAREDGIRQSKAAALLLSGILDFALFSARAEAV